MTRGGNRWRSPQRHVVTIPGKCRRLLDLPLENRSFLRNGRGRDGGSGRSVRRAGGCTTGGVGNTRLLLQNSPLAQNVHGAVNGSIFFGPAGIFGKVQAKEIAQDENARPVGGSFAVSSCINNFPVCQTTLWRAAVLLSLQNWFF